MGTLLREVYDEICDQLEMVKRSADEQNMESVLIVFLPDGGRFRVWKFGRQEPHFLWFNGEEEGKGPVIPGLFVASYGSVQFLFELRKAEREPSKRKPGFIDMDGQVVIKN